MEAGDAGAVEGGLGRGIKGSIARRLLRRKGEEEPEAGNELGEEADVIGEEESLLEVELRGEKGLDVGIGAEFEEQSKAQAETRRQGGRAEEEEGGRS